MIGLGNKDECLEELTRLSEGVAPCTPGADYPTVHGAFDLKSISVGIASVLADIAAERGQQIEKWGIQSLPSIPGVDAVNVTEYLGIPSEADAKEVCQTAHAEGSLSWADVALEEFCEAVQAPPSKRRAELVQLAAVVVAWIEDLDRGGK